MFAKPSERPLNLTVRSFSKVTYEAYREFKKSVYGHTLTEFPWWENLSIGQQEEWFKLNLEILKDNYIPTDICERVVYAIIQEYKHEIYFD